jgi:hypothetical protein
MADSLGSAEGQLGRNFGKLLSYHIIIFFVKKHIFFSFLLLALMDIPGCFF